MPRIPFRSTSTTGPSRSPSACVLALILSLALVYTPPLAAQPVRSAEDSAAVVRALWEETWRGRSALGRAVRLWAPSTGSDSSIGFSPALREALLRSGVPAAELRPTGDDTTVVTLSGWHEDSSAVVMTLDATTSRLLGTGAKRCRVSSGFSGSARLSPRDSLWVVEPDGRGVRGATACAPIEPR